MIINFFSILLFTFNASSFAEGQSKTGGSDRGGGNAVVCFNNPGIASEILSPMNPHRGFVLNKHLPFISKITTYDLVGIENSVFSSYANETHSEYHHRLSIRLSKISGLQNLLHNISQIFEDEDIIFRNDPLYRVYDENDSGPIDPEMCVISTMAQQTDVGARTNVTLDSRLFNHPMTDQTNRNVLILHEKVYKYFRLKYSDATSLRARKLIQALVKYPTTEVKILNEVFALFADSNGECSMVAGGGCSYTYSTFFLKFNEVLEKYNLLLDKFEVSNPNEIMKAEIESARLDTIKAEKEMQCSGLVKQFDKYIVEFSKIKNYREIVKFGAPYIMGDCTLYLYHLFAYVIKPYELIRKATILDRQKLIVSALDQVFGAKAYSSEQKQNFAKEISKIKEIEYKGFPDFKKLKDRKSIEKAMEIISPVY